MTQEERISRLEEQNYFLEKRITELDEALRLQQEQIDRLQHGLEDAGAIMERMRGLVEELSHTSAEAEVPPHYGKW